MRSVIFVALVASASAFGLAPATPALRSVGKASLPLASRPRARSLGGATKLNALGNLFGLGFCPVLPCKMSGVHATGNGVARDFSAV